MIWVVGGFPRSGTTAMMRLLGECGVPLVADTPTLEPSDFQRRFGLADGHAIKLLWPTRLMQLPRGEWSVVAMRRDPQAIVASWQRTQRHGWPRRWQIATMGAELDQAVAYLRTRADVVVHEVEMAELRSDPDGVAARLGLSR